MITHDQLRRKRIFGVMVILCSASLMAILAVSPQRGSTVVATTVVADRLVLVEASPLAAAGQNLQLVRYDIPPGVVLPAHTHPGTQIAWIESGVLNYIVVEGGSITVTHAWMEGSPEPAEQVGPGESIDLYPGDAVVEREGVVHYAQNLGTEIVVIWAATLLDPELPPAIVVTPTANS